VNDLPSYSAFLRLPAGQNWLYLKRSTCPSWTKLTARRKHRTDASRSSRSSKVLRNARGGHTEALIAAPDRYRRFKTYHEQLFLGASIANRLPAAFAEGG